MPKERIVENTLVALITALAISGGGYLLNEISEGGLVKKMGGVTGAELLTAVKYQAQQEPDTWKSIMALETPSAMPADAVVAFDNTGNCPSGWAHFTAGQSRVLIGATAVGAFEPGLGNNAIGMPLDTYKYRQHGGVERVTLTAAQMPKHKHSYQDIYFSERGGNSSAIHNRIGNYGDSDRDNNGHEIGRSTENAGGAEAVETMPPYIALYFCKKN